MSDYLVHRTDLCPTTDTPPEFLTDTVFFQMWKNRQSPAGELAEGDRLWWADKTTREVRWELRVRELLCKPYSSLADALGMLRRAYALLPGDLNDYFLDAPADGWLVAYAFDVMQPVHGVTLPDGEKLGRNGYRKVDDNLAATLGLPEPVAQPLASPPATFNASAITTVFAPDPSRYVPVPVRRAVWERDRATCQACSKQLQPAEAHFDHVHPYSRGGHSTVDNIQVLCAPCNLSKGATVPPRAGVRFFDEPVADLAAVLGRHQPRSTDELVELLEEAARAGETAAVEAVVVAVFRDPTVDEETCERCVEVLHGVAGTEDLVDLFSVDVFADDAADQLREVIATARPEVRDMAVLELGGLETADDPDLLPLLQTAADCPDRWVADGARLLLAGLAQDFDEVERLAASPVILWRSQASYHLAQKMFDDSSDGGTDLDLDQFLSRAFVALASSELGTSVDAALLLADFWASGADSSDVARDAAVEYLSYVTQHGDEEQLALAGELVDQLEAAG